MARQFVRSGGRVMAVRPGDVDAYRAARLGWLEAIAQGRSHVVVNAHWQTLCAAAHKIGVVPGTQT
jgi:hypothetical protein